MHPHDQAIEDFQALRPQRFTSLVRLDLRASYAFNILEPEPLLQLWLRADAKQEVEKPFLHLACYGVDINTKHYFILLWSVTSYQLQLKIASIRQHYLQGLKFEVSCFDSGYDDYNPLFACRHFEANLVTAFE